MARAERRNPAPAKRRSEPRPPAVARVLERVTSTARAHGMFAPGQLVLVACSGGPDSTCLLHAIQRLRRLLRIRLVVFHFDHRLRPDSAEDALYVLRQAERLGVPFVLREAADGPAKGQSVEAWARLARYGALTQAAADEGAHVAAVGHTADDQAETILLALVRGGGLEALAGMPAVGSVPPLGFPAVRPLIETTREEVEAFCRALRLRPREDPMNRDPRFLRARIRHELLPLLEERLGRGVRSALARTAELIRADAEHLDALADAASRGIVTVGESEIRLHVGALAALPEPIAARVVHRALRLAAAAGGEWSSDAATAHVRAVLDLARGRPGRKVDLPTHLKARRDGEYVRLSRASPEVAEPARRARAGRRRGASPRGGG
ncbi:MAG TPA: tRNA lysidine(34) synthetase TilS [Actinomycetota bacterium]|nr:tRNA lysidine(34) synthetase TilS [Actinomycetota bacterium]